MPAPKRPNTAAATEAVRRRGQETMAAKLREAGWVVMEPKEADIISLIVEAAKDYYRSSGEVDDHNELMDAVRALWEFETLNS
jgi:hypothetical protein